MDQGIIQMLKMQFRKRFCKHVLRQMDKAPSSCASAHKINLRDAIIWIHDLWDGARQEKIANSWRHCMICPTSFFPGAPNEETTDEQQEAASLSLLIGAMNLGADAMDAMQYVSECSGESEIAAEPSVEELLESAEPPEDELGLPDLNDLPPVAVTFEQAEAALQTAITYFEQRGADLGAQWVTHLTRCLAKLTTEHVKGTIARQSIQADIRQYMEGLD